MLEWFSSRRDSPIVARHEVPGTMQRGSPVPEGRLKSLSVPWAVPVKIRLAWSQAASKPERLFCPHESVIVDIVGPLFGPG
jgi:hypothetical protein